MLRLNIENKSGTGAANEQSVDLNGLLEMKDLLLRRHDLEPDPDKREQIVYRIAELNSGINVLTGAQKAVDQTKAELADRKRKQKELDLLNVAAFAQEFKYNVYLIAEAMMRRHSIFRPAVFNDDENRPYARATKKYYAQLFQDLTTENAAKQMDEILTADLQRRDWVEVVSLPRPPGSDKKLKELVGGTL